MHSYLLLKNLPKINQMNISNCKLIRLPKITDPRGNLTVVENASIPFKVERVFYLYDVPTGADRGAHAHRRLHQFIICLSGSFDIWIDDGSNKKIIHLNRPWEGLYIPPMIWAAEKNFDPGSVCLVLASDKYDESDYYRDYSRYMEDMGKL